MFWIMPVFVKYWWKSTRPWSVICEVTVCVGAIGLWHSVVRNISICAVWEPSAEFLTAHGGCLNIHTATMLLQHCFINISTLSKDYCHSHEYVSKKGDDIPHFTFVIQIQFKHDKKRQREQSFIGLQQMRQVSKTDSWHLTNLHHHMTPCLSINEEEQVAHPLFYSPLHAIRLSSDY